MKPARVVGAGISGLAAARCLRDAGFDVEIIEASTRPGGLVETIATPFGPVERAANAFVFSDATARWFARLGISPSLPLESSRQRFIYRDGRPRRWPLRRGETMGLGARLGWSYVTRRLKPREGESVARFVHRVAGSSAATWFVAPAMQGIYGAPIERLSAAAVFGGLRRPRGGSAAPPGGMGEFVARLAQNLRDSAVQFSMGAPVDYVGGSIPTVICTNARAAAPLVEPHAPRLAAALRAVEMTGLETATAFFEPHRDDVEGFGILFPRACGIEALGVLFNSCVFAGRGDKRSETWIYALPDADAPATSVADRIAADREVLTTRRDTPLGVYATRWPEALPVYDSRILDLQPLLSELPPWLRLSGNYLGQIGISGLLTRAEATVRDLAAVR